VVTHELGHALGLGGSPNPSSPMYEVLAAGTTRRIPAAADLNIPEPEAGADPERAAGFPPGRRLKAAAMCLTAERRLSRVEMYTVMPCR
jgi:hypothetical protein